MFKNYLNKCEEVITDRFYGMLFSGSTIKTGFTSNNENQIVKALVTEGLENGYMGFSIHIFDTITKENNQDKLVSQLEFYAY